MPKRYLKKGNKNIFKGLGVIVLSLFALGGAYLLRNAQSNTYTMAAERITIKVPATSFFNQDGTTNTQSGNAWFGNGGAASYLGLSFTDINVPQNAVVEQVSLKVTQKGDSWISQKTGVYVDTSSSFLLFTTQNPPSKRTLSTATVTYQDNVKWLNGVVYSFPSLNPLINSLSLTTKNNVNLILKGEGSKWGRKTIVGSGEKAPYLEITFSITKLVPPSTNPTPTPTSTPVHTMTPMPSATATATPTSTTVPSTSPTATPTTGSGTASVALSRWTPTKWDTCTQAEHSSYSVIGPDGKRYPTWHPAVHTRADGTKCTFGHEHGRNPVGYQYWDEVRRNFAFDANKDGSISASELATAGIPFGYVNEQIDPYFMSISSGNMFMRHEDHVGHKIEFANGEGDIGTGTDAFDSSKTGGLVVAINGTNGQKFADSGIRCYHFQKVHQGVSTPDAFTNNLHEIIMHEKCTSTRSDFPASTTLLSGMLAFGAPGEFTKFCQADRFTSIKVGLTDANKYFPGTTGDGMRNILTRDCVEQTVLVPSGSFSAFPYEIWSGNLRIRTADGRQIAKNGGGWEVLDAIRYFNPAATNKISYAADWCYETLGDRKARGGTCDYMTKNGTIKGITWDDPRSEYRGVTRGQYVEAHHINNAGGSQYWYTDPFGGNAKTTPFPGSIRQFISPVNATTLGKLATQPRIIQRSHDSGGGTVHAPN